MKKVRPKKCKNPECDNVFTPRYSTAQVACSPLCAIAVSKIKEEKKWRKEKAQRIEDLMTHKDWVQKLQKVFNTFIRERDKGKVCITCQKPLKSKYDAGHCFPAGHYANIRFHEDNVHAQCVHCNRDRHGAQAEYLINLPLRIGQERFEKLLEDRNKPQKYSIPELKALILKYKEKAKMIE